MIRQLFLMLQATLVFAVTLAKGQDMMAELDSLVKNKPDKDYVLTTFDGTRLINFHTVETLPKGTLETRIAHRFGPVSSGGNNFWGLDGPATIQLRTDYGLTNRLSVGIGRSSDHKIVDGFVKYKLIKQTTDRKTPVSITAMGSVNINSDSNSPNSDTDGDFDDRVAFFYQVMIARKFNKWLSVQLSPAFTHYNSISNDVNRNDLLSVIGSARYKITKSTAVTVEYCQRVTRYTSNPVYQNIAGIGFDVETGGHVFQIFLTNAYSINETRTIPFTASDFSGLRLGFNLSRVFAIGLKR